MTRMAIVLSPLKALMSVQLLKASSWAYQERHLFDMLFMPCKGLEVIIMAMWE
jgi:hypothetical protein